jgi:hypothetical protein
VRQHRAADSSAFHPRREGQLALARLLSCYLNQHPEAVTAADQPAPGSSDNPISCDA